MEPFCRDDNGMECESACRLQQISHLRAFWFVRLHAVCCMLLHVCVWTRRLEPVP
jgi:hypothetical protein